MTVAPFRANFTTRGSVDLEFLCSVGPGILSQVNASETKPRDEGGKGRGGVYFKS